MHQRHMGNLAKRVSRELLLPSMQLLSGNNLIRIIAVQQTFCHTPMTRIRLMPDRRNSSSSKWPNRRNS
jgi:hypothetical protein